MIITITPTDCGTGTVAISDYDPACTKINITIVPTDPSYDYTGDISDMPTTVSLDSNAPDGCAGIVEAEAHIYDVDETVNDYGGTSADLYASCRPENDLPTHKKTITVSGDSGLLVSGDDTRASYQEGEGIVADTVDGGSRPCVWFTWTPTQSGHVIFTLPSTHGMSGNAAWVDLATGKWGTEVRAGESFDFCVGSLHDDPDTGCPVQGPFDIYFEFQPRQIFTVFKNFNAIPLNPRSSDFQFKNSGPLSTPTGNGYIPGGLLYASPDGYIYSFFIGGGGNPRSVFQINPKTGIGTLVRTDATLVAALDGSVVVIDGGGTFYTYSSDTLTLTHTAYLGEGPAAGAKDFSSTKFYVSYGIGGGVQRLAVYDGTLTELDHHDFPVSPVYEGDIRCNRSGTRIAFNNGEGMRIVSLMDWTYTAPLTVSSRPIQWAGSCLRNSAVFEGDYLYILQGGGSGYNDLYKLALDNTIVAYHSFVIGDDWTDSPDSCYLDGFGINDGAIYGYIHNRLGGWIEKRSLDDLSRISLPIHANYYGSSPDGFGPDYSAFTDYGLYSIEFVNGGGGGGSSSGSSGSQSSLGSSSSSQSSSSQSSFSGSSESSGGESSESGGGSGSSGSGGGSSSGSTTPPPTSSSSQQGTSSSSHQGTSSSSPEDCCIDVLAGDIVTASVCSTSDSSSTEHSWNIVLENVGPVSPDDWYLNTNDAADSDADIGAPSSMGSGRYIVSYVYEVATEESPGQQKSYCLDVTGVPTSSSSASSASSSGSSSSSSSGACSGLNVVNVGCRYARVEISYPSVPPVSALYFLLYALNQADLDDHEAKYAGTGYRLGCQDHPLPSPYLPLSSSQVESSLGESGIPNQDADHHYTIFAEFYSSNTPSSANYLSRSCLVQHTFDQEGPDHLNRAEPCAIVNGRPVFCDEQTPQPDAGRQ